MISVPANPNAIEIRRIQTGCLKSEFDSTYPIYLNGIIGQDEFRESIENINRQTSSRAPVIICGLIAILCVIGGMILFIAGGLTASSLNTTHGFPVLVGVGVGLFVLGMLILTFGCCIIRSRFAARLHRAVADESMKYSTRSPKPCSWRLHTTSYRTGGYRSRRTVIIYRILIEIGNSSAPGYGNVPYQYNQGFTQPTSFFSQQNNVAPPPPYDGLSATGFCPQCGTPRQNSMAKFCPSCGQPFRY